MTAHEDPEMIDWLLGVVGGNSGSFLKSLADAGLRADCENYPVLRPALLAMKAKYPNYTEMGRRP